jgi:mannose-6-phosphate isomerase-like protein (cupin superfamily)
MMKPMASALALVFVASIFAQAPAPSATDISAATIQMLMEKRSGDDIIRMVNAGAMNVGVAVLQYPKGDRANAGGISHNDVPEVYYVLRGEGTMYTGGTLENPTAFAPGSAPAQVAGPSSSGQAMRGNVVSRKIGPGDVVIVPANTPHVVREITSDIAFLIVRMDPNKVMKLK